jgi:FKBP-type peptidyl-prolyl cis-trans isomerase SlyD
LNPTAKPSQIADDVVVSLAYTLTVNGNVVDSSDESNPVVFLQGYGNIIPGLERELYGLRVGDEKHIVVQPRDGYGEIDPDAIMRIPKEEFPPQIPLVTGVELEVRDMEGNILHATIVGVDEEAVTLDFNHPLAGQELVFDVKVVDLRQATNEELQHGHVHDEMSHEEDTEFEDEDEER